MKTKWKIGFAIAVAAFASILTAAGQSDLMQDAEVPGDNFSLEGALELFKKSKSPEEFERMLNSASSKVNNLDLNGDGEIDYIKVIDRHDANVHAFIMQAVISPAEFQDIAVIELEIKGNGEAVLQIVGDKDIYGIETIIEPTEEVRVNAGTTTVRRYVNVWAWPTVQYVYDPFYVSWVSPWGWYSRPVWWSPWRPVAYVVYRPYWDPYRNYYSVCYTHRVYYARTIYRPVRTTSVIVHDRHHRQIQYARETRGRDSYHNGRRDSDGRSYSNSRSSRQSSSNGRQSQSRSTGRQREYVAPSRDVEANTRERSVQTNRQRERTHVWSTPSESSSRSNSTPRVRPQSGNSDRSVRPSSSPRPSTSPGSRQSAPRPSVQPRNSGGREMSAPRSAPRQERSHGSSSSGGQRRGRD